MNRLLAPLLIVLGGLLPLEVPTLANEGAGQVSVVGGLTRIQSAVAGMQYEGELVLTNSGLESAAVRLYQTDYSFQADGSVDYGTAGTHPRSNAGWTHLTPRELTLPPEGTERIYYTVTVPDDPTLVGTYWSVVMVEPVTQAALDQPNSGGGIQVGITTVHRYAVQLITELTPSGDHQLEFKQTQLKMEKGHQTLMVDIANSGDAWMRPTVWAEVFYPSGASAGRVVGHRLRLFPGCSGRFVIALPELKSGDYSLLIVADNGDEHVFGTRGEISIP